MEDFSTEHPSGTKREDNSLLLGSKDPQLSHLFSDEPKTPVGVTSTDVSGQQIMDEGGQFHEERSNEPEYRLFEEQSYVPECLSPSNHLGLDGNAGTPLDIASTNKIVAPGKVISRSNGPSKAKSMYCSESGRSKPYTAINAQQERIASAHSNDANNNIVAAVNVMCERNGNLEGGAAQENSITQNFGSVDGVNDAGEYQQPSVVIPSYSRSALDQASAVGINVSQNDNVLTNDNKGGFPPQSQENANQYNMQLLAQHAVQNHPGQLTQQSARTMNQMQQNEYPQHQSSRALQQLAMGVNLRSSQRSTGHEILSSVATQLRNAPKSVTGQQFMANSGQITGVRAQLRKSLSSNGKLENINSATREWSRLQIPVGRSLDSSTGGIRFATMRMQPENDPRNIDNAPILKNLLADKPERRISPSDNNTYIRENGILANTNFAENLASSWPNDHTTQQNNLRSPLLEAKRNEFHYHRTMNDQQSSNPSPLHSPSYSNNQQFTLPPQPPSHQNTPLPQSDEQQFFGADSIMVNNVNGQEMDDSAENLNEMIIESENLVQDLIEAEANSNQSQQIIPYREARQSIDGTHRMTPPPAYNMDTGVPVMQSDPANNPNVQMYVGQSQNVKSEPQSPMIMSPIGQRSFFGSQAPSMNVHPSSLPLSSPTTPHHQVPMQPGMHPPTPVGEASWQFPMGGAQNPNYGSVPQSPVTPAPVNQMNMPQSSGQENIVQTMNYLPQPTGQTAPVTAKSGRPRRVSGGAGRKNPDGTLSCSICGHSFRSVPALNGHMRVHSTSADRKNKDERHRKPSGSSSGGNESRTPQSLSSPTTPTFTNKASQPVSMYQNPTAYNSVTLAGYSNPGALYSSALSTMDAAGAVVPLSQNINPRDGSLVHRIPAQPGIYSYSLPHATPMQPHDALLAAANLLAHAEPDHFTRQGTNHEEYVHNGTQLQQVPAELQHLIAQQQVAGQGSLELQTGFHGGPSSGVILLPQQPSGHSYIPGQSEHLTGSNVPFVNAVSLAAAANSIAVARQTYVSSPPQEQTSSSQVDNTQFIHQPLIQQTSNRSTPLADFADIAVLHDQGQLFSNNSMLVSSLGSQNQTQQEGQQAAQQQQDSEHMRLQDVSSEVGMLGSVNNDILWSDSQQTVSKTTREVNPTIKEEDFLPSSIGQIRKSSEKINQSQPSDPFIFPVSIPVQGSQDEIATSSALHNYYPRNTDAFSNSESSFHDDPLVQEAINVANPSTILPNSMMGGNPGGFRSMRQRHHSEGSILKKTYQPGDMPCKQELNSDNHCLMPSNAKTPPTKDGVLTGTSIQTTTTGLKRKVKQTDGNLVVKKVKTENVIAQESSVYKNDEKETEKWTVPAPPSRQRHRRHSADSRLQYKPSIMFPRSAYPSAMQMGNGDGTSDPREKRRPPPLIIPPSVNAYANGPYYISHLHPRRRPSGDSGSSCGNEKIPPYTPPPMLSPVRFGTGLYYNTPGTPSIKTSYRQGSGELDQIPPIPEEEVEDELVRSADPKINIGEDYQAEIPSLRSPSQKQHDNHNAELVWKPTEELFNENSTQSRHVEEFLKLACSAAVPLGGCNKEFALHLLHKNNGDIVASVQQLLHRKVNVGKKHWMASYTYMGTSKWSLKERQTFDRGMLEQHKDFYRISKMIRTKSTAECVDYYYNTVKRRKRRIQRPRRFRHGSDDDGIRAFSPSEVESGHQEERDFLQDYNSNIAMPPELARQDHEVEKKTSILHRSQTQTAFIRAPPQVNRNGAAIQQPAAQSAINYTVAQQIPQMHSYARQPIAFDEQSARAAVPIPNTRDYVPPHQRLQQQQSQYLCKVRNCGSGFPSTDQLLQHQQTHKMKRILDRMVQGSPSPSSSPASVDSAEPKVEFQCPRCGKTFGKVKSRNAHMKTHGKLAQEKRRQKEEEQRRKMEEAAAWRNRAQQHQPGILHPSAGQGQHLAQYHHMPSAMKK